MWVETIDGFIVNSDVLEKIEVELYRTAAVKSKSEPHRIEINMDEMSPEDIEKTKALFKHMKSISKEASEDKEVPEDEQVSEDIYEIRAWSVNESKRPYIFFRGGKNVCDCKFTEFKRKLGYIHTW